jgi:hypothetical protein
MEIIRCPKCKKIIGVDVEDYWSSLVIGSMVVISVIIGFVIGLILR